MYSSCTPWWHLTHWSAPGFRKVPYSVARGSRHEAEGPREKVRHAQQLVRIVRIAESR